MKVLVLGASGGVGAHLVRLAVDAGHQVTAVARKPLTDAPPSVRTLVGDVTQPSVLDAAVEGQDAVLSALGIRRVSQANPWSPLASPPDFTEQTARTLVAAMKRHGVGKVIAVSASGVAESSPGLNVMMRFFIRFTNIGFNYRDLARMEQVYAASGLDWCCVRPVGLKDGPVTGRVVTVDSFPLGAWISRADVADWMIRHLDQDLSAARCPQIREARA